MESETTESIYHCGHLLEQLERDQLFGGEAYRCRNHGGGET
jgi:hypothetical protein